MEQLFNRSALAQREKWQTRQDYRDRSIKRAIEMCIQSSPKLFGEAKVLFDPDQFFEKDKFLHEKFAKYLIKKAHIIKAYEPNGLDLAHTAPLMYYNDQSGLYELVEPIIHGAMLGYIDRLKINQRREVLEYIRNRAPYRPLASNKFLGVQNGILDMSTKLLLPFSPDIVLINKIPVSYNPSIMHDETLFRFLNTVFGNNEDMLVLMFEIAGYLLSPDCFMQKFFIFTGAGGNGKSATFGLLTNFLGAENISSLSLTDIGAQFRAALLHGKLANIGDDIEGNKVMETATLKKIVSGEPITVERKNQHPFSFTARAKLLFAANSVPNIYDRSLGMTDRLIILPFLVRIRSTPLADPHIIEKLKAPEVLSCLLNHALIGLERLRATNCFTMPDIVKEYIAQYQLDNDPVAQFIQAVEDGEVSYYAGLGETTLRIDRNTEAATVYWQYKTWAERNGYRPLGDRMFGKEMKRLGCERKQVRIGYKRIYVYEKLVTVLSR